MNLFNVLIKKQLKYQYFGQKVLKKNKKLSKNLEAISNKLGNKSFIERAPKHIVEQEKNTYNELKSDIDKINLTIKSLK